MATDQESESFAGLDEEEVVKLLEANGRLSLFVRGFEPRPQQKSMLCDILKAYNQRNIALIEAGTGTGKSLAYLLPAILWNAKFQERTVISTNTINLQEQLLYKDIPLLAKALGLEFKAALFKGMGNYVCLRKLDECKYEMPLLSQNEAEEITKIEAWRQTTQDGSRSSLPLVPSPPTWERVGAEFDTCSKRDCAYFKECYYFKARQKAAEANVLIVNHHLLFSDLISRDENKPFEDFNLLPPYTRVILDEAHNIEDIATDFFANRLSQLGFLRVLSRLASEKHGKTHGKLSILKHLIQLRYRRDEPREASALLAKLNNELPALRWDISELFNRMSDAFLSFTQKMSKPTEDLNPGDLKLRLLPYHKTHPDWDKEIVPAAKRLLEATQNYVRTLNSLEKEIAFIKDEKLTDSTQGTLFEIKALANRLDSACDLLSDFIKAELSAEKVKWIEVQYIRNVPSVNLLDADLNVSRDLARFLFNRFLTTTLVSATLTTNRQFGFMRKRLGVTPELLPGKKVIESCYDSPFNYKEQAMLVVPTDMPQPAHPEFITAAVERIFKVIQISRGNCFVLFTSYSMLRTCFDLLVDRLRMHKFYPLKQGDTNRQNLLTKFRDTDRSVLFGTDSFWEGVDVAGEALRCVIIVKLPFKVPTEPIIQARSESILAGGGDPFMDYSLPSAIVKFKQGFGRLIRKSKDRGCIVCLDTRILNKGYGKMFLNSLPDCQQLFGETSFICGEMESFYKRTYHLTLA